MNRITRIALFALLLFTLALSQPSRAMACSCDELATMEEAATVATAIFSGTVVDMVDNGSDTRVTLQVQESWKGADEDNLVVTTRPGSDNCGYVFEMDESYLVYTYGPATNLNTSACTRTQPLSLAAEDIDYLDQTNFQGTVRQASFTEQSDPILSPIEQDQDMSRLSEVTIVGYGQADAEPDRAIVTMTLAPTPTENSTSAQEPSLEDLEALALVLIGQGVPAAQIELAVNEREYWDLLDTPREFRTVADTLRFSYNFDERSRLLALLTNTFAELELSTLMLGSIDILFTVQDCNVLTQAALSNALNDAQARALLFAQEQAFTLGPITQIAEQPVLAPADIPSPICTLLRQRHMPPPEGFSFGPTLINISTAVDTFATLVVTFATLDEDSDVDALPSDGSAAGEAEETSEAAAGNPTSITASIALPDGLECQFAGTGATLAFDEKRLNYTCSPQDELPFVGLIGPVAQSEVGMIAVERATINRDDNGFILEESTDVTFLAGEIELADGTICAFAGTGATLAFDDERINYTCGGDLSVGLLGPLTQGEAGVWNVVKVQLARSDGEFTIDEQETVAIAAIIGVEVAAE